MPFDIEDYNEVITRVIKGGFICTPRLRLYAGISYAPSTQCR